MLNQGVTQHNLTIMKTKLKPSRAVTVLVSLIFGLAVLPACAQDDSVTISAAEFQRMVYSSHLLTELDEKPELDASLQVLLEMQRRNPHGDSIALAGVLQEATARYRTNAPVYIRDLGYRDEVLAAYLSALLEMPARTNVGSANLALLNYSMLGPQNYTNASAAEWMHAGNQRLFSSEEATTQRDELVEHCTQRAQGNGAFAQAMESLLLPETLVSLWDSPVEIIGNTNSSVHGSLTMESLLGATNWDGSLTVSSNQLMILYTNATQILWDTIHTNLALRLEINQGQPDLLAYLNNQASIDAYVAREAEVKQGQRREIASATAAIIIQSKLMEARDPLFKLPREMEVVGGAMSSIAKGLSIMSSKDAGKFTQIMASGNFITAGFQIFDLLAGGESPEEEIVRELGNIKTLINDLSVNMNYRFDRVDQSLTSIFDVLNDQFEQIVIIGGEVQDISDQVDDMRRSLVNVQVDLHRLERHVQTYIDQLYDRGLNLDFNNYLGYEFVYTHPMVLEDYEDTEVNFFTHAVNNSVDGLSSPYSDRDYTPEGLYWELTEGGGGTSNRLDQNLSYIKKYLNDQLGQPTYTAIDDLSNPREWFVGSYAYLQLALENPWYFRQVNPTARLDLMVERGEELTDFLSSLTFTDTGVNRDLHYALLDHYETNLNSFLSQVRQEEQQYADDHFVPALENWRQWASAAPCVTLAGTELLETHRLPPVIPRNAVGIAGGGYHSLALKNDGTVAGWGDNTAGQTTIPQEATNVIAIAGGLYHSLALRSDGLVVCWGTNDYNQCIRPAHATNVVAIAAGYFHSVGLRDDGEVVAWGAGSNDAVFPHYQQSDVPSDATNIVAIAGGGYHSLALRPDGEVMVWGLNNEGQRNIPESATNVMAIAAGHGHNLVLKSNGTLVAWGNNLYGSTNIPPEATNIVAIAAAGWHCLAQRADGKVFSWGWTNYGQTIVPNHLTDLKELAAGRFHSLALKRDGTVLGWGHNQAGQCVVPGTLTWAGAISLCEDDGLALEADGTVLQWNQDYGPTAQLLTNAVGVTTGEDHSLSLRADGSIVGWGANNYGQITVPQAASNGVAVAAGSGHSLALRVDGAVVGWGANHYGQATGVPSTNYPYTASGEVTLAGQKLTNVIAIDAAGWQSLALKSDGTVVSWGRNDYGQCDVPAGLSNVVAVAGGSFHSLALKADSTVASWGDSLYGQTNVPVGLSNVVAVAAGTHHSLSLKADGTVMAWGNNGYGQTNVPAGLSNVVAIQGDRYHSLALKNDGTMVVWGSTNWLWNGPVHVPVGLSNVVAVAAGNNGEGLALQADGRVAGWHHYDVPAGLSNVVAVSAGQTHCMALKSNGDVVAWGWNGYGETNVPGNLNPAVDIAGGDYAHSIALQTDGKVRAWGYNNYKQCDVPSWLSNVVSIAAGYAFNLALRSDGTVVGWGFNYSGQATGVPKTSYPPSSSGLVTLAGQPLTNVVAVAAGGAHGLALRADGTVVGWGHNGNSQCDAPQGLGNVVAIAAGNSHSLALRMDGSVVAWGGNDDGECNVPKDAANVVAMAAGNGFSLFVKSSNSENTNAPRVHLFVRSPVPIRLRPHLLAANEAALTFLDPALPPASTLGLAGSKSLLEAVLSLGMPYTLERDDILRGFLYGEEPLVELHSARRWLTKEIATMQTPPYIPALSLSEVADARLACFERRIEMCLDDLAQTGQPEIPRMVGHTLRLMNLLRDAWATVPPTAVNIGRQTGGLGISLYGEPYAFYTLQESPNLTDWFDTSVTKLRSADTPLGVIGIIEPNPVDPEHYYRAMQPAP